MKMANKALEQLRAKAKNEAGVVVALGVGWVVSIPIAIISAQNLNWGWLAFAALLHAFCSSWFFFWFFYAQMATLFFMNAAAVVEAVESLSLTNKNPETSNNQVIVMSTPKKGTDAQSDEPMPFSDSPGACPKCGKISYKTSTQGGLCALCERAQLSQHLASLEPF
jgi:hypothetical protein